MPCRAMAPPRLSAGSPRDSHGSASRPLTVSEPALLEERCALMPTQITLRVGLDAAGRIACDLAPEHADLRHDRLAAEPPGRNFHAHIEPGRRARARTLRAEAAARLGGNVGAARDARRSYRRAQGRLGAHGEAPFARRPWRIVISNTRSPLAEVGPRPYSAAHVLGLI